MALFTKQPFAGGFRVPGSAWSITDRAVKETREVLASWSWGREADEEEAGAVLAGRISAMKGSAVAEGASLDGESSRLS